MASFKFNIKDANASGDTLIFLRFEDGVNRGKFYIQQSIHPKDWNVKQGEARKSLKGYADLNNKLKNLLAKCKELHLKLTGEGKFTVDTLKQAFRDHVDTLNNRKRPDATGEGKTFEYLADFATYYCDTVGASKKKISIRSNRQTINLLREYETAKRKKLRFDSINLDFYHDFIDFLTKRKKEDTETVGLSTNTIGKHITTVKVFMNQALERGLHTNISYKSKRFKTMTEDTETIYLTEAELQKIYAHDFSKNKKLEQTRDLFIVGCETGLRFSDFSQLRPENIKGNFITVRTQKTDKTVIIPIHWMVREILEKYSHTANGLPRTISNQKMNDYLKEIGKDAGITERMIITKSKGGERVQTTPAKCELITTHCARRSFATNYYKRGVPSISIMAITGHKTEKAFMRYIRISQEDNAALFLPFMEKKPLQVVRG